MTSTGEALGQERRLIFRNYANGVDIAAMKEPFKRSEKELLDEIFFVAKKLKEYRFRRCADGSEHAAPPVPCDTLIDIRINRFTLFETLNRVGNVYLSTSLLIPKIAIQKVDSQDARTEIKHRIAS